MTFDPNLFLETSLTGSNSTTVIPVPEGEYPAMIEKLTPRTWTSKDGTKSGVALDVLWEIMDDAVKAQLERDKVTCKQGLMLDMTDDGTSLDMGKGKNVGLGRLREAVGLNEPGKPFSFPMLIGQMGKVVVKHRIDDQGNPQAEIKAVLKLA